MYRATISFVSKDKAKDHILRIYLLEWFEKNQTFCISILVVNMIYKYKL